MKFCFDHVSGTQRRHGETFKQKHLRQDLHVFLVTIQNLHYIIVKVKVEGNQSVILLYYHTPRQQLSKTFPFFFHGSLSSSTRSFQRRYQQHFRCIDFQLPSNFWNALKKRKGPPISYYILEVNFFPFFRIPTLNSSSWLVYTT